MLWWLKRRRHEDECIFAFGTYIWEWVLKCRFLGTRGWLERSDSVVQDTAVVQGVVDVHCNEVALDIFDQHIHNIMT